MEPSPRLSEKFAGIERWMIPVLLALVVIVGAIRLVPWAKSKLFSEATEAQSQQPSTLPTLEIDTDEGDIIDAGQSLENSRSAELSNVLSSAKADNVPSEELVIGNTKDPSTTQAQESPKADVEVPTKEQSLTNSETQSATEQIASQSSAEEQAAKPASEKQSAEKEITGTINNWANAWSEKDIETYINSYEDSYKGTKHNSHTDWRVWRTSRVSKPKSISVRLSDLAISVNDGNQQATAKFIQDYNTEKYKDRVLKQLRLTKSDDRWKITQEEILKTLSLN